MFRKIVEYNRKIILPITEFPVLYLKVGPLSRTPLQFHLTNFLMEKIFSGKNSMTRRAPTCEQKKMKSRNPRYAFLIFQLYYSNFQFLD